MEAGDVRFSARFIGKNMPAPRIDVLKYDVLCLCQYRNASSSMLALTYPSTSPSFFPLAANSLSNSTPTKRPVLPLTFPMNLTMPYISPGTSTGSPTFRSEAILALPGVAGPPVRFRMEVLRFTSVAVLARKDGDEAVLVVPNEGRWSPDRCLGVSRDMAA
jgi:hypothetical protein